MQRERRKTPDVSFFQEITGDSERIFYIVLPTTGRCPESSSDGMDSFEIHPDGCNIFRDMRDQLLKAAAEQDKKRKHDF